MSPTSLYIHIPWCIKKCPYCDFNSHNLQGTLPEDDYLQALILDLEKDLIEHPADSIKTIFFGGGTPSLMSGKFFGQLLDKINAKVAIEKNAEITLEANPGTTDANKFLEFRDAGINRLSLGIQSFNDRHLESLGRIHNGNTARQAIDEALKARFQQINLDIMFGLPNQTLAEAIEDITQAISAGATHLSWYQLTVEKNTVFYRNRPTLPVIDLLADMQDYGKEILKRNGYQQYEISAYSQTDPCQHNLNYWSFGDYLGIGAGAHGKVSTETIEGLKIVRYSKTRVPTDYLEAFSTRAKISKGKISTVVATEEFPFEFLLNALRVRKGFSLETAKKQANLNLETLKRSIPDAFENDLLNVKGDRVQTTDRGWDHVDSILEMLL